MPNVRALHLAVVGTDSNHTLEALRLLNREARFEGVRVTHLVVEPTIATVSLAAEASIPAGAVTPTLAGAAVNGVLVLNRSGRDHVAPALEAIERGLPVFVDKPLAGTAADAASMLDRARVKGVPLTTRSALRYSDDLRDLRRSGDLVVSGPADLDGDGDDLLFYGIHVAELAHELVGPLTLEEVRREQGRVAARCHSEGRTVTIELLDWNGLGRVGFRVNGTHPVRLHDDYLLPVLEHAVAVFRGADSPAYDDLLGPLLLMEGITDRLSNLDR